MATLICYTDRNFRSDAQKVIDQANDIIAEYQAQGFTLTLRQLYYQFVSRAYIANKVTEYKRLGSIINDARLAGLICWQAIEDRLRVIEKLSSWDGPQDVIRSAEESYRRDLWEEQEFRPEVWIEKDALVGVIERVCEEWRVPYIACRGYASQSMQWRAAMRFAKACKADQVPIVLHLGDHDPSGIDMTRDNADRLKLFLRHHGYPAVEVRRLALNMDQVRAYRPPPNPAKETDSRHSGYQDRFGDESWELDALNPPVIEAIVRQAIFDLIDLPEWRRAQKREDAERKAIRQVRENWDDAVEAVKDL